MTERYKPLKSPPLFPHNAAELRDYMEQVQYDASRDESGVPQLTDFSSHSPVVALNEGMIFALLELYYFGNRLPRLATIAHLENAGIFRKAGSHATVEVEVTLTSVLNTWTLSTGFVFKAENGLRFQTTEQLTIQNGFQGTVAAIAFDIGTAYNVAAYTITQWTDARAYLKSATNPEPAAGGRDEETEESAMARGFTQLRDRNVLITVDDFTRFTQRILGDGAAVKVIGRLGADKLAYDSGTVHIFALNPDGTELTESQLTNLDTRMNNQLPVFLQSTPAIAIASRVYISSLQLYRLNVTVIAKLVPGDNPTARADAINMALTDYLRPGNLSPGATVLLKELEFQIRQQGVQSLQSVMVSHYDPETDQTMTYTSDIPLPQQYSVSDLRGLDVVLVDASGRSTAVSYGEGDPD